MVKTEVLEKVKKDVEPEQQKEVQFKKAYGDLKKTQEEVDQIVTWMGDRYYWADVLSELRRLLIRVEQTTKKQLRTDAGVWVEELITSAPRPEGEGTPGMEGSAAPGPRPMPGMDQAAFRRRYGLEGRGAPGRMQAPAPPADETAPGRPHPPSRPKATRTKSPR